MNNTLKFARRTLALVGMLAIAQVASAQTIRLKLAHSGAEAETQHAAALEFAKQVKARTNGQIEVQVFPGSALGNDNTAIAGVRGGTIDMTTSGTPYYTGMVGRMNVLDLPYMFNSPEHAYKVLDGSIGRGLLDELEAHNMKGLAYWEVGFRSLTNSRRPVKTPEDIKGLKIRTTPNPAHLKAFQLFGATPTPMPLAEVFPALENKAVDGQENPVGIVRGNKFNEVQKYMSMTRHAYTAMPVVMNKAKFAALTPAQQQALTEAALAAGTFQRDLIRKTEAGDIAYLRANGMQIEENINPEPFRKLVAEPIKQMFAEKYGTQLVDAVPTRVDMTPALLPVVDAHHHLWDLSHGRYPWLQQDYDAKAFFMGDYTALCQDFMPHDYQRVSQGCHVVATVHVEAERDRSEQVAETAWVHAQQAQHGFPHAVVAHVWLDRPETEERLREHLQYPLVRGIRSKPVTSTHPGESVRGQRGTLQDERWLRGLGLLDTMGLSWDLRVPYWHLTEAAEVAAQFPNLPIVLNHHGFAWDRSAEGLARWRSAMAVLARQPNVHVKLSEFGLRDQAWDWTANAAIVHDTLAMFGWERCMFASNFPVAGLRIGYGDLVLGVQRMLDHLLPHQQRAVMAENALRFYRISLPTDTLG